MLEQPEGSLLCIYCGLQPVHPTEAFFSTVFTCALCIGTVQSEHIILSVVEEILRFTRVVIPQCKNTPLQV